MVLVLIQLFKVEYKEELFMALSSAGIHRTTYCDATNLENELAGTLSLFSGILKNANQQSQYSKLYICVADDETQVDAIIEGFEIAGIDWRKEEIFQISVLPILKSYHP